MFTYPELSKKAQKKARKDYLDGWAETHPDDPLTQEDACNALTNDLTEECYDNQGNLVMVGD